MEHDLVALVGGVQGVSACRVSYRKEVKESNYYYYVWVYYGLVAFSKSFRAFF